METLNNIGYIIIETGLGVDDTNNDMKIISQDGDRVIGQGILQEANMKNRNGRFYDSRDLFPELTCPRTLELLSTGNMKAENGHPMSKELTRQQTIDPNNTVAVFLKFWTDGDFVMGTFMGDENDKGAAFDRELRKGRRPSWSLRALGNIQNTKRGAEVKNVKLITYDRVIYPSHNKAYTIGLVNESASLVNTNESKIFLEDNDSGILTPITTSDMVSYIQSESTNMKLFKEFFDLNYNDMKLINGGRQVQLTDKIGSVYVMNLESYIHDEIMNACYKMV